MNKLQHQHLLPRAIQELARNSYPGAGIYLATFAIIIFATGYQRHHPQLTTICLALLLLLSGLRLLLAVYAEQLEPQRWVRRFTVITLLIVAIWSGYWSYLIYLDGLNTSTHIAVAAAVGIASAGIGTLSPHGGLAHTFIAIMLGPLGLALMRQPDGAGTAYAVMTVIVWLFLSYVTIKLYRQFWSTLESAWLLEQRADELARATRAKSDFLARMSHEIRTPMNGILGITNLMQSESLSPKQRKYVSIIRHSGEALLNIINDILDLSRVESGRIELEYNPFNLFDTILATTEALQPAAGNKQLQLNTRIASNVPRWIQGDAGRLRQILTNLLSNAIKFTESGEVNVRVSAQLPDGQHCLIRTDVSDSGIGISEDARERIFEAFSQADSGIATRYGGTGLGLTICRQLTEMMGGKISVQSTPGKGSTFTFILPFRISVSPDLQDPAALQQTSITHALNRAHILVAEDNEVNRVVTGELLKKFGCKVTFVEDGEAAIRSHASGRFDAILMDMQMPGVDGFQATRAIRASEQDDQHTPIIAITAAALQGDRERCLAAGLDDYLSKPVDPHALLEVLNRWIHNKPDTSRNARLH